MSKIKQTKVNSKVNTPQDEQESKMVKSKILRVILIVVGFISLALGTVGIVVPFVLPTVPFYLLTSFCFLKSSKRFNNWFLNSKLYHRYLENFAKSRCMVIYNEIILLLFVSGMLMCALAFTDVLAMQIIFPILIGCKYGYFVFKVKPISKPEFNEMMLKRKQLKDEALKLKEEQSIISGEEIIQELDANNKNTNQNENININKEENHHNVR